MFIKRKIMKFYAQKKVKRLAAETGDQLHVNNSSKVTEDTHLGDNVNFNGMSIHGKGTVTIGDNFHSGEDCVIMTSNHNYNNGSAIPYDDTYIHKDVIIGDNVWLGRQVTILPGVTINEGAIIQAGSTVTKEIPKGAIAGGHPAEVFDQRDMKHYKKHKLKENFH
jgi:acetyltransferase-like isoleucine patch superfamily enzyme